MASPQQLLAELEASLTPMSATSFKLQGLLYGRSGSGKTVEAAALAQLITPPDQKIIFIDTGQGWVSLLNHPNLMNRMQRMRFEGRPQIDILVKAVEAGAGSFANVGSIIFDEFSTVAKKDIHLVNKATGLGEFDASEFKQYNIATRRMEETAWRLLDLEGKCNLIFISHEVTEKNERTKVTFTRPSFMDKFGNTLKENMHVVAHMEATIDEQKKVYSRMMQVHPTKMMDAKSRIGGLDIKVTPDVFNARVKEWMAHGTLVDEQEVVELSSEKQVDGDFSDQVDFAGYEVE